MAHKSINQFKFFRLLSKKLGGAIALDGLFSYILVILYVVSKGRHYLCLFIYSHTIHLWINSLVPEWPTFIDVYSLCTPTTGNPDVWSYTRSPAPHLRQYVIVVLYWTNISRRSAVFVPVVLIPVFVLLCCCWSLAPPTVSPWILFVFVLFLRKFDRFWRLL